MKRHLAIIIGGMVFFSGAGMGWASSLTIVGSTTLQPIVDRIAQTYMEANPGIEVEIIGGGSGNGIKAIIDATTDIGTASRFIKAKELRYAHGKGVYPVPFQVAYDSIVPIVHPENKVQNLTVEQLRDIYSGSLDNWKVFAGDDLAIKVISRDTSSGTYEVWENMVMEGQAVMPSVHLESSNAEVVNAVANERGAIGYIGLGYLTETVKSVHVNGVEGNTDSTLNGSYPLSRPLFMFTRGWPAGEVLKFVNFVLSPNDGQPLVAQCGFVALYKIEASPCVQQEVVPYDPNYLPETTANIQRIQEYLEMLGYPVGRADGIKGDKTITAIFAFQKENNLALDWRISNEMVSLLTDQYMQAMQINP